MLSQPKIGVLIGFMSFLLSVLPAFSQDTQAPPSQPVEIYVWGKQPTSTATEQTIRAKDFELRPTATPSDVLRLVPGLFIAQHAGGGKADQIFQSREG